MSEDKIRFVPVRGRDEDIQAKEYHDGYVYFAIDTGSIYIDSEGQNKRPLGGAGGSSVGSGIILGNKTLTEEEEDSDTIVFSQDQLNISFLPEVDAIILNVPDGSFYRVLSKDVSTLTLTALRLTVAGGGGGGVEVNDTRIIRSDSWKANQTFIYGKDFTIKVGAESDVDDYVDLGFLITQNGTQVESFSVSVRNGSFYNFNTSRLPKGERISIQVQASSINSKMKRAVKHTIDNLTTVELSVTKDNSFKESLIASGNLGLTFLPKSNGLYQTLHVIIDGKELDLNANPSNRPYLSFQPTNSGTTVIIPEQTHGNHHIELYTSVTISGVQLNSESLHYDLAWKNGEVTDPIIWIGDFNHYIVNYNEAVIPFMVWDYVADQNSKPTKVYLYCNGREIPTSPMEVSYSRTGEWIKWDITNLYEAADGQPGKENTFRLECGSAAQTVTVYVTKDNSRELGLVDENALIVNLKSIGRSNSETTTSRSNWSYQRSENDPSYQMEFENFNWYNNGWFNDEDGNGSYLSIANGASAKLRLGSYNLNSSSDYAYELRFRVRNIQEYSTLIKTIPYYYVTDNDGSYTVAEIKANGYTIKKDQDGNPEMDKQNTRKEISQNAGVVLKYVNSAGNGFCVGTQEAYFKTPGAIANVRYKEDEIINLTFVVSKTSRLLSIYLNGILSGALDLGNNVFAMYDTDYLTINSEFCDIDLFNIRVYKDRELTMPDVIHNYISDIHDINLYDQNQLTAQIDGTILLYSKLLEYNQNHPDNLSMPYAVFEIIDNQLDANGNPILDPGEASHNADDDKLPYKKGNNRFCKITFVNPSLDAAWENGLINDSFYKTHSPSYVCIGADINVQGTSSQAYPRRNFKTKMKSAVNQYDGFGKGSSKATKHDEWGWFYTGGPYKEDWETWINTGDIEARDRCRFKKWYMDNEDCSTNKFTWKIDYMESSGTYNTGFANLVGTMYNYHPLYVYRDFPEVNTNSFRTSIYGFPVMVFHKHSTTADKQIDADSEYLTYEYIGRYNYNLDKSSNEYFGFEIEGEQPYLYLDPNDPESGHPNIADIAECWELEDNQGTWTSFKYPDADARLTGFGTISSDGVTLEAVKHFEARYTNESDQVEYARGDATSEDAGITDVTQVEMADGSIRDLSTQELKNRYLREKYSNLEKFLNWLDSTDTTNVPAENGQGTPISPVTYNDTVYYMIESFVRLDENDEPIIDSSTNEPLTDLYYVNSNGEKIAKITDVTEVDEQHYYVYMVDGENAMTNAIAANDYTGLKRPKSDVLVTYTTDCAPYRLKKFVNEFNQHLDLEYCLIYFILTELLLCYDSRGKNMMLASWGPKELNGDYIWFPLFYDIDTQLGLNNIGAVLWDYDTDATIDGTFSTANSVLWQNFFAGFRREIEEKYRSLRKASRLTEETIEGAYLCSPDVFRTSYAMKGVRPVIALGLDEWYKYIAPGIQKNSWYTGTDRRFGFYVESFDDARTKTTDASYVYTCQGDRKLSRELFIRNRLNYLDSWWLARAYDSSSSGYKTEIMIRANANDLATSDEYVDKTKITEGNEGSYTRATYPVKFYDATPRFTITPFLSQYVTVFYDEDPITPPIKYDGLNPVETNTTPSVENGYKAIMPYNEQLTYIPGGDFLSDIGDLSLKYPSHFKLNTGKRLTQLLIGGDAPNYFNGIIGKESGTFDLNDRSTSTNKKGLLQKLVLTGLTALNEEQDISGSEKLREYRALKTQIPVTTFANGAPLDTVHLPKSTERLNLIYSKNLTNILEEPPQVMIYDDELDTYVYNDHELYKGLYVEGLTDYKSTDTEPRSICTVLNLVNVALGYDSYKLLDNAVQIRERFYPTSRHLKINFENVEWSPYTKIESDVNYNPNIQFYVLTDHNDFEEYNHVSAEEWNYLKLNDRLYIYNNNPKENYITNLNLLKTFDDSYNAATDLSTNYYQNNRNLDNITRPNITGVMYVNNDINNKIAETDLEDVYRAHYPDLTILAKYVAHSYILKFVYVLNNGKEDQLELLRYKSNVFDGFTPHEQLSNYNTLHNLDNTLEQKDRVLTDVPIPSYTNLTFKGWSLTKDGSQMVYNYNLANNTLTAVNNIDELEGYTFTETNNTITLYAIFEKKKFRVNYYDGDGHLMAINGVYEKQIDGPNDDQQFDATMLVEYDNNVPFLPIIPQKTLPATAKANEIYPFIGWGNIDGTRMYTVAEIQNTKVTGPLEYYAIFGDSLEDVHNYPTSEDYFTITEDGFVSVASDITLSGKIVIPNKINNIVVKGINGTTSQVESVKRSYGFYDQTEITHIFLEDPENSQLSTIRSNGCGFFFRQGTEIENKLRYFELPEQGNVVIESSGFRCANNLLNGSDIDEELTRKFFSRIKSIGFQAFFYAYDAFKFGIYLPANITAIESQAFNNCAREPRDIIIGSPEAHLNLDKIQFTGNQIFGGSDNYRNITIYTDNLEQDWVSIMNSNFGYDGYFNYVNLTVTNTTV